MSLGNSSKTMAANNRAVAGDSGAADGTMLVLEAASGGQLMVPGGRFLLTADYARQGDDLVLTGKDGTQVLIRNFFSVENPPVLVNETGMEVGPELAARLAGPESPGQYAQAAPGGAGKPIGEVTQLDGQITVTRTDGTQVVLNLGDKVFQGDVVETGDGTTVSITFIDDTRFRLGQQRPHDPERARLQPGRRREQHGGVRPPGHLHFREAA